MQNFPFSIFDFQLFFVSLHRILQINMLCEDLYSTLSPIIAGYEQVCFVADEKLASQLGAIPGCYGGNTLSLPGPESSKTLDTVTRIWDFLFEKDTTRRGLLVAVGGGVLTDLAGFAAALWSARPDENAMQIRERILRSADRYDNPDTENYRYGYGIPDAWKAYTMDIPTGIESIQNSAISYQKLLRDGQLYIIKGDKTYTVTGVLVTTQKR